MEKHYQLTEKGHRFYDMVRTIYGWSLAGDLAVGRILREDFPRFKEAGLNLSALVSHHLYEVDAGDLMAVEGVEVGALLYESPPVPIGLLITRGTDEGLWEEDEGEKEAKKSLRKLISAGLVEEAPLPISEYLPVLDTKTGIRYKSKSAAAVAIASEYGLDPEDRFAWFKIIRQDPERFKSVRG